MKKSILCLGILFISISGRSQLLKPEVQTVLEEYFFIPVTFDHFGTWLSNIEKDSSLIFINKIYTKEQDSVYLKFDIKKPDFNSPVREASEDLMILITQHHQRNFANLPRTGKRSLKSETIPGRKLNMLRLILTYTFDSSESGKKMATKTQKDLEKRFNKYFENTITKKGPKKITRHTMNPNVIRNTNYYLNFSQYPILNISHTFHGNINRIELYLTYELKE